jgi:hypothetical protein
MSDDDVRSFLFAKVASQELRLCKEYEIFLSSQSFIWQKKKLIIFKTSKTFVVSKRVTR